VVNAQRGSLAQIRASVVSPLTTKFVQTIAQDIDMVVNEHERERTSSVGLRASSDVFGQSPTLSSHDSRRVYVELLSFTLWGLRFLTGPKGYMTHVQTPLCEIAGQVMSE